MLMKKKLNIKEFSEKLGVSAATVSRAFSDKGRINEQTRLTIIRKARELGYHANIHASSLSGRLSDTVGFFYPAHNGKVPDYFIAEIQQALSNQLSLDNRHLAVYPVPAATDESAISRLESMILGGAFGAVVIVAGSKNSDILMAGAEKNGIRHVVIGYMKGKNDNSVLFDNEHGAMLAGRYFAGTGRKHPAYITGHLDRRKRRGFIRGLGAELGDKLISLEGGGNFIYGTAAFRHIRENRLMVDCVLCANDLMAFGFIRAALDSNVAVPDDIAVIGFDDICVSRYFTPALSSVSLNLAQIGEQTAAMLSEQFSGTEKVVSRCVDCDLILRQSS